MTWELRKETDREEYQVTDEVDERPVYTLVIKEPSFFQMAWALDKIDEPEMGFFQVGDRLLEQIMDKEASDDEILNDNELRMAACKCAIHGIKLAESEFKKK